MLFEGEALARFALYLHPQHISPASGKAAVGACLVLPVLGDVLSLLPAALWLPLWLPLWPLLVAACCFLSPLCLPL